MSDPWEKCSIILISRADAPPNCNPQKIPNKRPGDDAIANTREHGEQQTPNGYTGNTSITSQGSQVTDRLYLFI